MKGAAEILEMTEVEEGGVSKPKTSRCELYMSSS